MKDMFENLFVEAQYFYMRVHQPGKPAQNAYRERSNQIFREEIPDAYLYDDLQDVRAITEHWLKENNLIRPGEDLQGLTPHQYAIQYA